MLAAAGAALGTSALVQIKPGWVEPALLWLVGVGHSGDGKSPALSAVSAPLYVMQEEAEIEFKKKLREWKKPHADEDEDEDEEDEDHDPKPTLDRLFLDDTTVEAIAPELRANPKGFPLINDELSAWVRGMGRYQQGGGGAERSFWLKSWGMQPWSVTRKGHRDDFPLILHKPFVAVLGGIQPDLLSELADDRGREDGFLARLLPVFPPSLPVRGASAAVVSVKARKAWRQCLTRLRERPVPYTDGKLTPHLLPFTEAAQEVFDDFMDALAAEINAEGFSFSLRAPWLKLNNYCARLALILQAMRWACDEAKSDEAKFIAVDETSVRGAIMLVAVFKTHIRKVYRRLPATPGDRKAERVLAWVRKQEKPVSGRDVARYGVAGITKSKEGQAVLEGLARQGVLQRHERRVGNAVFTAPRPGTGDQ